MIKKENVISEHKSQQMLRNLFAFTLYDIRF